MQTITSIDLADLAGVSGGNGNTSQAELRQMAEQHCPRTYAQNRSARTITRPMAERCLDEAGYGMFKGRLDRYFPPRR